MNVSGELAGSSVSAAANYVRLEQIRDSGLFLYRIEIHPEAPDDVRQQEYLVRSAFRGRTKIANTGATNVYFPQMLEPGSTTAKVRSQFHGVERDYEVRAIFVRQESWAGCVSYYNDLFNRILVDLGHTKIARDYFDLRAPNVIPEFK
jgi:hypothetical protein